MSAVKAERYAANEGYGEDFLGLVPKPWLVSRLKDKATFNPSKSEIKELPKECTFAPMEKLKTDSLLTDVTVIPSNISGSYTYFRENDLLIAKVTPCFENRNVAIAKNLTNGIGFGSSEINVVRVSKKANQRWFFYLFLSSGFIEAGASKMAGAGGLKRIPSIFLETFAFALPPLSEQTAIAAYLDTKTAQIDRQIDLLSQKVTQYGKLKRSLINETVTRGLDKSVPMKDSGVEWIGEVPENWDIRRIKEIFIESKSKSLKGNEDLLSVSEYTGVTLKQDNVGEDEFLTNAASLIGYKLCKIGDLVINIMLAWKRGLGVSAYYGIASPSYAVYTPQKEINSSFFHYRLRNEDAIAEFKRNSTGIIESRLRLYSDSFYALSIAVPPLDEQTAIAAYLDEKSEKIDRIIDTINTQIYKLKDLRKALINDVVTGKIKVGSEGQTI